MAIEGLLVQSSLALTPLLREDNTSSPSIVAITTFPFASKFTLPLMIWRPKKACGIDLPQQSQRCQCLRGPYQQPFYSRHRITLLSYSCLFSELGVSVDSLLPLIIVDPCNFSLPLMIWRLQKGCWFVLPQQRCQCQENHANSPSIAAITSCYGLKYNDELCFCFPPPLMTNFVRPLPLNRKLKIGTPKQTPANLIGKPNNCLLITMTHTMSVVGKSTC